MKLNSKGGLLSCHYCKKIVSSLGTPYIIQNLDQEPVIYRKLDNGYEFEVSGIQSASGKCRLYVWQENPRALIGIYNGIPIRDLKDVLGYYAFKYQNLSEKIQIEREDQTI
jgi:hypothetical protein